MATTSNTIAAALEAYKKDIQDGNFQASPLIDHMTKQGVIKPESGRDLNQPLMVDQVSTGVELTTGSETINPVSTRPFARFKTDWSRRAYPIVITNKDLDESSGSSMIFSLAQEYLVNALNDARRDLSRKLVANTGGSAIFENLISLNGMASTGSSTGVFEGLAFGSQTNTLGGVAKSTYTTQWQHQFGNVSDAYATNGRSVTNKVIRQCVSRSPRREKPTLILASEGFFAQFEASLQANERYMSTGGKRDTGAFELLWQQIPVAFEPDMPASATADETVSAYVLNLKNFCLSHTKGGWMNLSKWQDMFAAGLDGQGCTLVTDVALTVSHLPSSGVIVDGDV